MSSAQTKYVDDVDDAHSDDPDVVDPADKTHVADDAEKGRIDVTVVDLEHEQTTAEEEEYKIFIPPTHQRTTFVNLMLLLVVIGLGMLEGAAFQRSGVYLPEALGGQMVFRSFIVLKMFISAVGASMVCQGILNIFLPGELDRSRQYKKRKTGLPRVVIGSLLIGAGMALAGSGPTMTPSQAGAGVRNVWTIVLGLVAGGIVFGIIDKVAPQVFELSEEVEVTLEKRLFNLRYEYITIPTGAAMLCAAIGLEFLFTQKADEARLGRPIPWYPTIAGAIIGINQVPVRLIAGHGQGGSTSIMNLIGTMTCGLIAPEQRVTSFKQIWQFAFVWVGTSMGSLMASQLNDVEQVDGYTHWRNFVGGFVMMFGAAVARGCTCGHGVSGFSELSIESMVAACCIFGGGIATGFAIYFAGGHMCCSNASADQVW